LAQVCGAGQVTASQLPGLDEDAAVANLMGDADAMNLVEMHTGRGPSFGARLESAVDNQRREMIAFFEEAMRDIDIRIARIERNHRSAHAQLPAWQYLVRRREDLRQLRQEV
jgi:hypothetical protein